MSWSCNSAVTLLHLNNIFYLCFVTQALPPYNGFGSYEDSLQSCLSLVPQPPKKDFIKMLENDHKILRFEAIMVRLLIPVYGYHISLFINCTQLHTHFNKPGGGGGQFDPPPPPHTRSSAVFRLHVPHITMRNSMTFFLWRQLGLTVEFMHLLTLDLGGGAIWSPPPLPKFSAVSWLPHIAMCIFHDFVIWRQLGLTWDFMHLLNLDLQTTFRQNIPKIFVIMIMIYSLFLPRILSDQRTRDVGSSSAIVSPTTWSRSLSRPSATPESSAARSWSERGSPNQAPHQKILSSTGLR